VSASPPTAAPAVSIVTIFLDAHRFIRDAIDSVVAQTFRDWELLLVDDGSRDGGTDVARECARAHPGRVRYLEHPGHANRGMSASRNLGIREARGVAVAFLDADDVWLPRKLERQVGLLAAHPDVAMVYGPAHYWHAWPGAPDVRLDDFVQDVKVPGGTVAEPPSLVPLHLGAPEATPSPSGILVTRSALARAGGFEEEFRGMYEDQALYVKLGLSERIFVSDECWYRYRQHDGACCAVAFRKGGHEAARRAFLAWASRYVAGRVPRAPEVERALARERARMEPPSRLRAGARAAGRALLPARVRVWLGDARRRSTARWSR